MSEIEKSDIMKTIVSDNIDKSLNLPGSEISKPNYLVVQVVNDRPDSIEVKEDAKGNFHATLKVYGDFVTEPEKFITRTIETWKKVNKDLLMREIPVTMK